MKSNLLYIILSIFGGLLPLYANSQVMSCDQKIPAVDVQVQYYEKQITAEGVQKEVRYTDLFIRRASHVWIERVLPKIIADARLSKHAVEQGSGHHKHKHFDAVLTPRHIFIRGKEVEIEFIDPLEKQVIAVPKGEYDNIQFDGSWNNACFFVDPKNLANWKLKSQKNPQDNSLERIYTTENKEYIQTVTWVDAIALPKLIEVRAKNGTHHRRIEFIQVTPVSHLPWEKTKGFIQREYSDFLD